jgi:hypothetical protein
MFTANNSLLRIWNPSGIREIFHSTGCDHCCTINWKILILVWQCQLFFDKFSRSDVSIFRIMFFIAASKQLRLDTVVPLSQSDFPSTLSHHWQSVRIRIGLVTLLWKNSASEFQSHTSTQPRNKQVTHLLSKIEADNKRDIRYHAWSIILEPCSLNIFWTLLGR